MPEEATSGLRLTSVLGAFVAATNALVALVFGFIKLSAVPLDARILIVGGASLILWTAVLVAFYAQIKERPQTWVRTLFIIGNVVISAGVYFALDLVTEYHTIRLEQPTRRLAGVVQIRAPRLPVDFDVSFQVSPAAGNSSATPVKTRSIGPAHLPADAEVINKTILVVRAFRHPQQLEVSCPSCELDDQGWPRLEFLSQIRDDNSSTARTMDTPVLTSEDRWILRRNSLTFVSFMGVFGCLFGFLARSR